MNSIRDLLAHFRELSQSSLLTLNHQQIQTLLAHFHNEAIQGMDQKQMKTKKIRKFNRKSDYKKYVRSCINTSIKNVMLKICKNSDDKEDELQGQNNKTIDYSNYQLESTSNYTRKIKNFNKFMHTALVISNHQDLSCSICLQLLICPSLTICGHVFCFQCLDENLLFSSNCPNCRQNIKGSQPIYCTLLDQFITKKAQIMQPQADWRDHFFDRKNKFEHWKARRHIELNTLQIGQQLDVRDTESIWCQGTVIQIYYSFDYELNQNVINSVLIHYNRWHKLYNQIIEMPTNRLAPLLFFSGRVDIPRYNLSQQQDNMRGSVVSGGRVQLTNIEFVQSQNADYQNSQDQNQQEEIQSTGEHNQERLQLPQRSYYGMIARRPFDMQIDGRRDYNYDQQANQQQSTISQLVQAYMRRIQENAFIYSSHQPQQNHFQPLQLPDEPRADPTDREQQIQRYNQSKAGNQQKTQENSAFPYQYSQNQPRQNLGLQLKQQVENEQHLSDEQSQSS